MAAQSKKIRGSFAIIVLVLVFLTWQLAEERSLSHHRSELQEKRRASSGEMIPQAQQKNDERSDRSTIIEEGNFVARLLVNNGHHKNLNCSDTRLADGPKRINRNTNGDGTKVKPTCWSCPLSAEPEVFIDDGVPRQPVEFSYDVTREELESLRGCYSKKLCFQNTEFVSLDLKGRDWMGLSNYMIAIYGLWSFGAISNRVVLPTPRICSHCPHWADIIDVQATRRTLARINVVLLTEEERDIIFDASGVSGEIASSSSPSIPNSSSYPLRRGSRSGFFANTLKRLGFGAPSGFQWKKGIWAPKPRTTFDLKNELWLDEQGHTRSFGQPEWVFLTGWYQQAMNSFFQTFKQKNIEEAVHELRSKIGNFMAKTSGHKVVGISLPFQRWPHYLTRPYDIRFYHRALVFHHSVRQAASDILRLASRSQGGREGAVLSGTKVMGTSDGGRKDFNENNPIPSSAKVLALHLRLEADIVKEDSPHGQLKNRLEEGITNLITGNIKKLLEETNCSALYIACAPLEHSIVQSIKKSIPEVKVFFKEDFQEPMKTFRSSTKQAGVGICKDLRKCVTSGSEAAIDVLILQHASVAVHATVMFDSTFYNTISARRCIDRGTPEDSLSGSSFLTRSGFQKLFHWWWEGGKEIIDSGDRRQNNSSFSSSSSSSSLRTLVVPAPGVVDPKRVRKEETAEPNDLTEEVSKEAGGSSSISSRKETESKRRWKYEGFLRSFSSKPTMDWDNIEKDFCGEDYGPNRNARYF